MSTFTRDAAELEGDDDKIHAPCGWGLEGHVMVADPDTGGDRYQCGFKCAGCGDIYEMGDRNGDDDGYYCPDCFDEQCESPDYTDPYWEERGYLADGTRFAFEGSALRAATKDNPRNLPCPTCGEPNRLTPADRAQGYQCDSCADAAEMGY